MHEYDGRIGSTNRGVDADVARVIGRSGFGRGASGSSPKNGVNGIDGRGQDNGISERAVLGE